MNIKCFSRLAVASAIVAMVCSCSQSSDDASMAFESYSVSKCYRLAGSDEVFLQDLDITYADSVSLILPLRLNGCDVQAVRDTITAYALGVTGKPILSSVNEFMTNSASQLGFEAELLDKPGAALLAPSYDFISGFVLTLTPDLMVYCIRTESQRAGAAHGMTTHRYINYLLHGRGQVLALDYIFTPEGLAELPERIAEQALSLSDIIGPTSVDALPANDNFYISADSEIVFSYQPYEIASYAQGTIDIPFYLYELSDLMTPAALQLFALSDLE